MGVDNLIFFCVGSTGYLPSDLIPDHFSTILGRICNTANQLLELKYFCRVVLIYKVNNFKSSNLAQWPNDVDVDAEHHSTLTYQAFATAVRFFIHDVHSELLLLEKSVQNQVYASMLSLFHSLEFLTRKILHFYTIYSECTLQPKSDVQISSKYAVHYLLDNLWRGVIQSDLQIMSTTNCLPIVIGMFLITIAPTFNFVNQWLTVGIIHDKYNEFFIQQLLHPSSCDELYILWSDCYVLIPENGFSKSPSVFLELESNILSAGKAISSLEYIGIPLPHKPINLIYISFINLFFKGLGSNFHLHNNSSLINVFPIANYKAMLTQDNDGPFLVQTVCNVNRSQVPFLFLLDGIRIQNFIWKNVLESRRNIFSSPSFLILQNTLNAIILPLYQISSSCLAWHLHSDSASDINSELRMLFNLYLFGDALTMQTFTENIFKTLENSVCLQDSLSLTSNLHQALAYAFPNLNFDEKVFVTIKEFGNLNDIKIHYFIGTLASIVITPPLIQQYQHLFSFLLNVKWVEWILNRAKLFLKRHHQTHMQPLFIIHEMGFYISIVSQYFFHQIIFVEFQKFRFRIKSDNIDTDILVNEHQLFINSIFSKCFLDNDHSKFVKQFDQLFSLCSKFCIMLFDEYLNHTLFSNIRKELHITIKRLFTVLRIPTVDYNFEFLKLCLNYNNYISANIINCLL